MNSKTVAFISSFLGESIDLPKMITELKNDLKREIVEELKKELKDEIVNELKKSSKRPRPEIAEPTELSNPSKKQHPEILTPEYLVSQVGGKTIKEARVIFSNEFPNYSIRPFMIDGVKCNLGRNVYNSKRLNVTLKNDVIVPSDWCHDIPTPYEQHCYLG